MNRYLIVFLVVILLVPVIALPEMTYEVKKGDTLWDLANTYLNNPFMWNKIYEANKEKIENPDLIYPGQTFVIPDVNASNDEGISSTAPVEEGMTSDMGDFESRYIEENVSSDEDTEPVTNKLEDMTTKVATVNIDVEKLKKSMVFGDLSDKMAYKGGFITNENLNIGHLNGKVDKENKNNLLVGEEVYVKLNKNVEVKVGDKLSIYKKRKHITNYKGKGNFGDLYYFIGTLKVEEVNNNICKAKAVEISDLVDPGKENVSYYQYIDLPKVKSMETTDDGIEGYIIATNEELKGALPHDIVYINLGSNDGVESGDIFEIVKPDKNTGDLKRIGLMQVLYVRDETSSGVLLNISDEMYIKRGYKIRRIAKPIYE